MSVATHDPNVPVIELRRVTKTYFNGDLATEAAAASLLGDRLVPVGERRGSSAAREELIDFIRAGTGKPEADPKVRRSVLRQLFFDLRSHPESRALFEEIMARDPVLREAARQALEQTPQSSAASAISFAPRALPSPSRVWAFTVQSSVRASEGEGSGAYTKT